MINKLTDEQIRQTLPQLVHSVHLHSFEQKRYNILHDIIDEHEIVHELIIRFKGGQETTVRLTPSMNIIIKE